MTCVNFSRSFPGIYEQQASPEEGPSLIQRVCDFVFSNNSIFWIGVGGGGAVTFFALGIWVHPIAFIGVIPCAMLAIFGAINYFGVDDAPADFIPRDQTTIDADLADSLTDAALSVAPILRIPVSRENSWAASVMHYILHIPSLEQAVSSAIEMEPLRNFISAYREYQALENQSISEESIELVIQNLCQLESNLWGHFSLDEVRGRIDFSVAMQHIMDGLPLDHALNDFWNFSQYDDLEDPWVSWYGSISPSLILQRGFLYALSRHFPSNLRPFEIAPREFVLRAAPSELHLREGVRIPFPETFEMPSIMLQNPQPIYYECDAFIKSEGGLFSIYMKKQNGWWCCRGGEDAYLLSCETLQEEIQKGQFHHYILTN